MEPLISRVIAAAIVVALTAACSGQAPADQADAVGSGMPASPSLSASESPSTGLARVSLPVTEGADVAGLVDVNGHDLAVHCTGSGQPTVVMLHGWIDQPGLTSYSLNADLLDDLGSDFRSCTYDRANVGDSETVSGTQTPEMVVSDLDGLMSALGDQGPYVLLGQSQGGMVASAYAVAHPDKVAGIVMLDASFDDEITLEDVGMLPEGVGPCDPVNRKLDGEESLQKIDNCAMYQWAYQRRDLRPEVPLVYLAAKKAPWDEVYSAFGPAYTKAIVPLQQAYAESWSPGKFQWVDSGHDIYAEQPAVVGDVVRWVVTEGRS